MIDKGHWKREEDVGRCLIRLEGTPALDTPRLSRCSASPMHEAIVEEPRCAVKQDKNACFCCKGLRRILCERQSRGDCHQTEGVPGAPLKEVVWMPAQGPQSVFSLAVVRRMTKHSSPDVPLFLRIAYEEHHLTICEVLEAPRQSPTAEAEQF